MILFLPGTLSVHRNWARISSLHQPIFHARFPLFRASGTMKDVIHNLFDQSGIVLTDCAQILTPQHIRRFSCAQFPASPNTHAERFPQPFANEDPHDPPHRFTEPR